MNLIAILEQEEIARLTGGQAKPEFAPGDTVIVSVNVVEGTRKRVQAFEGVVIAKRNRGQVGAYQGKAGQQASLGGLIAYRHTALPVSDAHAIQRFRSARVSGLKRHLRGCLFLFAESFAETYV
jgi:hypothetical protein